MTNPDEHQYLDEKFDRAWGTTDEIFAPSPTIFSAFGGYDVKSDLGALLMPSYERIDEKTIQQIGYDNLKRVVDELAEVNKPAEIQRLAKLVSQALETDCNLHCLDLNAQFWEKYYPQSPNKERIEYEKRMKIPNQFLEYIRKVASNI